MEKSLIERIRLIKKELGYISDASFADDIEVNRSNFSQMMKGKRPIGDAIINKICIHKNISKAWLVHGEGEMIKGVNHVNESTPYYMSEAELNVERLSRNSDLLDIIKSQQRTIENLSKTIERLSGK